MQNQRPSDVDKFWINFATVLGGLGFVVIVATGQTWAIFLVGIGVAAGYGWGMYDESRASEESDD